MKWAKSFGFLLFLFCLFFGLSPLKQVKAATIDVSQFETYFYTVNSSNQITLYGTNSSQAFYLTFISNYNAYRVEPYLNHPYYWYGYSVNSIGATEGTQEMWGDSTVYIDPHAKLTVVYKGNITSNIDNFYGSYEDYEDSITPSWWDNIKSAFMDFVGSDAMSAVVSGDWLSYLDEVLYGGLWTVKVGEGEDELVEFYTISATPSPSPSPTPTMIPVQVNIDPVTGNVTYNYYIDVSGTPVPTSSPINPNPPTGSGGGGSDGGLSEPVGVEDYYEPDDSLSLPNLRIFQFKLNLPGTETDIGVDSLDNNFEVMNGYLEDNAEAITTVSSFFQVIPSEWFLLLGAIACFPIIAAMIKSLLGG